MKKFIVIVFTLLMLISCAGTRKTTEKNSTTSVKEKTEVVIDSTKATQINKMIDDAATILVTRSDTSDKAFNEAVDKKVDEILSKLNLNKQSGDNGYSLAYDALKRELEFRAKVGETKSESQKVSTSKSTEKSFEQTTDEYISKKVTAIPWWFWVGLVVWFLPQVIEKVTAIINPISGFLKKKT